MKTRLLFLLPILFIIQNAEAQEEIIEKKVSYFNYVQSGLMMGKDGSGSSVTVSTVHGLRVKKFGFGIGIGYDDYSRNTVDRFWYQPTIYDNWKSMPVFAAVSYDWLSIKSGALFIQVNGGYSTLWARNRSELMRASEVDGGMMLNPMAGLRFNAAKMRLYVSAGYKVQRNSYTFTDVGIWSYPGGLVTVDETLERAVITIGFGFN